MKVVVEASMNSTFAIQLPWMVGSAVNVGSNFDHGK